MIQHDLVISAARECVGTPFRHQGRLIGVGLDCAGVVLHVARALGLPAVDVPGYGRNPSGGRLESALDGQCCVCRVDASALQPGDVLLMRFSSEPQHLAICTGSGIVHAYEAAGACVEHVIDSAWRRRIVRAYRFIEVANV